MKANYIKRRANYFIYEAEAHDRKESVECAKCGSFFGDEMQCQESMLALL